jgi:L-glutamine-phosphate cytidylyltransferase
MKTIIIAAGEGKRIANEYKNTPKSLIPVNGKTIFERQKNALKNNGILDLIVITGSENKFKDTDVKYISDNENEKHDILGSLMVAKEHLKGELIISYSDIIFQEKIIEQLTNTKGDIVIAVDLNWKKLYEGRTDHPISEAENVLCNNKNEIIQIKKNINNNKEKIGEFLGLIKLTEKGSKVFLEMINDLQKNHIGKFHNAISLEKGYLTDMIQEMIDSSVKVIPSFVSGTWCEIDTKQDLDKANKLFI